MDNRFEVEARLDLGLADPSDAHYFEATLGGGTVTWPMVYRIDYDGTRTLVYHKCVTGSLWWKWRHARRAARQFARSSVNKVKVHDG